MSGALRSLLAPIHSIVLGCITYLPGETGFQLRNAYYRRRLRHLGAGARIDVGVQIHGPSYVSIGDNTWIDRFVVILAGPPTQGARKIRRKENPGFRGREGDVTIGANCHIAPFTVLCGHGGIAIGDNSGVASGGRLYSISHHYRNVVDPNDRFPYRFTPRAPQDEQSLISSPVVMADNSGLGLNSVMLPGSTVGENSWVGVNSLVSGSIPPNTIAAGSPAAPFKNREQPVADG